MRFLVEVRFRTEAREGFRLLDSSQKGKTIKRTERRTMPENPETKNRGCHHFLRRQLRRHLKASIEERAA